MYVNDFARGESNKPERPPLGRSFKGYPEVRDPAAENPQGVLQGGLDEASLRRLRQHYSHAPII